MATESVDEILWMVYEAGAKSMEDSGGSDHEVNEAKTALDAYYTRECARKVLEELTELHARWSANQTHGDGNKSFTMLISKRIAELRAAIQEVGGGK